MYSSYILLNINVTQHAHTQTHRQMVGETGPFLPGAGTVLPAGPGETGEPGDPPQERSEEETGQELQEPGEKTQTYPDPNLKGTDSTLP